MSERFLDAQSMTKRRAETFLGVFAGTCIGYGVATGNVLILAPVLGVTILLLIVMIDPFYLYGAVIALSFVNPFLLPPLFEIGEFTFRIVDVLFFLLIFRLLLSSMVNGYRLESGLIQIMRFLLLLLAYFGFTLVVVAYKFPEKLSVSIASYTRLLETILLLPVTYMVLKQDKQLSYLLRGFVILGTVNVLVGLWQWYNSGLPFSLVRVGGLLGINSLGLASALMIILGIIWFKEQPKGRFFIVISIIAGLVGLLLAKSVSSTLALFMSLGFYFGWQHRRRITAFAAFRRVWSLGVAFSVAVLLVWLLRRADVIGLIELSEGSLAQRLAIMYGGLQIFLENPIIGIGWQASTGSIGALDIRLPYVFQAFPEHYFEAIEQTSLHNMYVQFLAELGLVGIALFLMFLWQSFKEVAKTIKYLPEGSIWKSSARVFAFWLIAILIWWNTNPLFPGQIETTMAMVALGSIAAIKRIAFRHREFRDKIVKSAEV